MDIRIRAVNQSLEDVNKVLAQLPQESCNIALRQKLELQKKGLEEIVKTFDQLERVQQQMFDVAEQIPFGRMSR